MDTRQLQAFIAIYESGGISRAAEQARTAPSVLSHHLANLQAQFSNPLFVRHPRGLLPTEYGKRLYLHATQIVQAMERAHEDLENMAGDVRGRVVIGMAYTALTSVGRHLMRIVLQQHPGITLVLTETLSGSTVNQMMDAQVDLALAYNPAQDSRIHATALLEERMLCIGKKQVIGNTTKPITVKALLDLPFVLLRRGTLGRSVMDDQNLQKQFESQARLQADSVQAVNLFVLEGHGCVIGSQSYLRDQLASGEVSCRPIIKPIMRRTLFLCEHRDKPASRAVELVRTLALQLVADEVRAGTWDCERILFGSDHGITLPAAAAQDAPPVGAPVP
ncbi:LysR family transcriptional regulator [Castellaniella sp.]|uniref:LysR family transcriptional regulator n=1 Tax=Castellaniella sp. TaxID=1955812 RepID=UPI002AFEA9C6|nr:LysR family transcriptional regulator [Castellaniella sp.]